jgi:hypothetical protein
MRVRPPLLSGAWLWLALGVGAAHAEAPGSAEASAHFERGVALVDTGEMDEAIAEFEQAYHSRPHPDVLFNLAQAYRAVGRSVEAARALEQYLQDDTGKNGKRRQQAEALLRLDRRRIGTLELTVQPAGALVAIDGAEIGVAPLAVPLSLVVGTHALTVALDGYETAIHRVLIQSRAATTMSIELQPEPKPEPKPLAEAPTPAAAPLARRAPVRDTPTPNRVRPALTLVGAISGGLLLAGAGTIYAINTSRYPAWQRDRAALDAALHEAPASADLLSKNSELGRRALGIQRIDDVAIGLGLFGGALLAGSAALWLTAPRDSAAPMHVAIGPGSVAFYGNF